MLFCLWEIHHFWGIYRSVLGLSLEHTKIRKAVGLSQDLVVVDNLCDHMIGNVYVAWPLGGALAEGWPRGFCSFCVMVPSESRP